MSQWTGSAQAYLDAGGEPTFFVAVHAFARRFDTSAIVPIGYWSGIDDIELTIEDEVRNYLMAGDALEVGPVEYDVGTDVRSQSFTIFGMSEAGTALYRDLDLEQAPADIHHVMMNAGGVIIGTRRLWRGVVDGNDLSIDPGGSASLAVTIASRARAGTRVIQVKKSDQSYRRRDGDTAMQYASLKQVESDTWQ